MESSQHTGQSGFNFKNIQYPLEDGCHNQPQDCQRRSERINTCTGFEIADWKKAQQQKKSQSNMIYKGRQVSCLVQLPFFKIYGSGIYLFFSFLWEASMLFLILGVVSLAPIILNIVKGNAFSNAQNSLQFLVAKSSIGNYFFQANGSMSQSQSLIYKQVNASLDLVGCFVFLAFFFYWQKKSQKIVTQINSQIKLLSSSTLQITQFPEKTKQKDIQQFMSKFGKIIEVAPVKFYSQQIALSKQIYEVQIAIKQLQIQALKGNIDQTNKKIEKLKEKTSKLQNQLQTHEISRQQILKFYVQFETAQQRNQILNKFKPYQRVFSCFFDDPPQQMLIKNQKIKVQQCITEPTGIIWQNVHVTWKSRWLRMLLQFIIILIIILCGFILISLMNILLPPTQYNVDTSSYSFKQIQSQSNTTIVGSWCVKHIQFPASPYQSTCSPYWTKYIMGILITVGISITIVIFKTVVKLIMINIAKFQRYTDHTSQSVAIMTNLLITYISTTVLITFLMQANVFHISFKSFIKNFIQDKSLLDNLSNLTEYYDLTSTWYRDIGYQIWFNVFLLSFIPHLFMPLILYFGECMGQMSAKSQKLHRKMYQKIRPAQFQIEDNYANILMIILIGFVFGGGSPCMILVSFIGLITRYVYFKYLFIRFSRIPKTFNQSLNNRAISILKITLMLRCMISIYMYGADSVFAMEKSAFMKWSESLELPFFSSIFVIMSRVVLTWYYSIAVIVFLLALVFKNFIVDTFIRLCKRQNQEKMNQSNLELKNTSDSANFNIEKIEMMSQRILTKSYKLQNNPDYHEILAIMKMRFRKLAKNARQSISPIPILPEPKES